MLAIWIESFSMSRSFMFLKIELEASTPRETTRIAAFCSPLS